LPQFFPQWNVRLDGIEPDELETPRYNIAPTQSLPAIVQSASGTAYALTYFRWGLVPFWADDLAIGSRLINARGETVAEKPSFRKAFAKHRCLVIADGYYEWQTTNASKQPYLIERIDGRIFAFAGLWEENTKAKSGVTLRTCSLITTESNELMSPIHDRMPVILEPAQYVRWLDPTFSDTDFLKEWMIPAPKEHFRMTPVSKHVGNVRNHDATCATPIGESITSQSQR
jgi:putative SOS response-associated peptidase YedK